MRPRSRASYRLARAAEGKVVRDTEQLAPGLKRCPDCREIKPLDEFPGAKNTVSGRHSYCKPCHNIRGVETADRLYGGTREYHLRRRYGIGEAEFRAMFEAQGGLCAICQEKPAVHVEHDHATGAIRGLACFNCNGALGHVQDRVDILQKAIEYLERNKQTS
jgi:hypothetical protein